MQNPKIQIQLRTGNLIIETLPEIAPKHVKRICELVKSGFYDGLTFHRVIDGFKSGFYDGLTFHRVIDGFMAQTGCPNGDGTGRTGVSIPAEFSKENFTRGAVGMARTHEPDSADSQFFICLADCEFLNGKYTLWGRVISGMEHVDKIKKGDEQNNGHVKNPDKIIKMTLV